MAAALDVIFRRPTIEDAFFLADHMRAADRAEVLASGGYSPIDAVDVSLQFSEVVRAAEINGELLCLFGVTVVPDAPWSVPWLLSTTAVDRYPLAFWRASKAALAQLRERYPFLLQQVDARYTQALSWLRRLGFTIEPAQPFGAQGLLFHRVTLGA